MLAGGKQVILFVSDEEKMLCDKNTKCQSYKNFFLCSDALDKQASFLVTC